MEKHKTRSPHKLVALLAATALFGSVSQGALALTASNTTISNLATLNYAVGGVSQTAIGSSEAGNTSGAGTATTFVVDKKVNLTVAEVSSSLTSVSPAQTAVVTAFTVTNTGNDPQDFALAGANVATGQTLFTKNDNFDVTGIAAYVDANANGTYESGTDTATFIDELAAGASKTVFVVAAIPAGQVNGDAALVSLTATAKVGGTAGGPIGGALTETAGANTAGVDIVFADGTGDSGDGPRDAAHSARDGYLVASAIISISKTATVLCDPVNGVTNPKNIPGAIVRWTITVSNSASATASATLATVADSLDANTTHDVGLRVPTDAATCIAGASTSGFKIVSSNGARTLGGTAGVMTNAADADGATIAGQNVTIDYANALPVSGGTGHAAGELKIGESATVTFNVIIN